MAVSTQKLLILLLILNVTIGIGLTAYEQSLPTTETIGDLYTETSLTQDETETGFFGPNAQKEGQTTNEVEGTYGNAPTMGSTLFDIIKNSVTFFPAKAIGKDDEIVISAINGMINLMRITILALMGFELYLVIKNRKNT